MSEQPPSGREGEAHEEHDAPGDPAHGYTEIVLAGGQAIMVGPPTGVSPPARPHPPDEDLEDDPAGENPERELELARALSLELAGSPQRDLTQFAGLVHALWRSSFVDHVRWEDALYIALAGADLGMGPTQALRNINVIDGKPTLRADAMAAICRRSPCAATCAPWIRPGDGEDGPDPQRRDAISIVGNEEGTLEVYNVVVDHCSLSWGIDETLSTWYRGVRDVTVTRTLLSEALDDSLHPQGPHSKAFLIGDNTRRISMIENVLAHNVDRNPIIKGDATALVVNNLVYDPGRWPLTLFDGEGRGPSLLTAVGNHFVRGPSTPREHSTILFGEDMKEGTRVYLEDNIGLDGSSGDPWSQVDNRSSVQTSRVRAEAPPVWVEGLEPMPAATLEAELIGDVGARPWDRDATDARVIRQIGERSGGIIDSVSQVEGLGEPGEPTRRALELPEDPSADEDGDGWTALDDWLDAMTRPE